MKINKIASQIGVTVAGLTALMTPLLARAVVDCGGVKVAIDVQCSDNSNPIYAYLQGIIVFMGGLIGLFVVISLIVAGIQYAGSGGEPANIAKAKERIFNAVIGLLLYIMMAAILTYLVPNIFS